MQSPWKKREGSSFSGFCTRVFIFRGFVIHSYKTILYCPFCIVRSNNCNITLINNNQMIRFAVDQFIDSILSTRNRNNQRFGSVLPWIWILFCLFLFFRNSLTYITILRDKGKWNINQWTNHNTNRNKYGHCRGNTPYKSSVVLTSFTSIVYC